MTNSPVSDVDPSNTAVRQLVTAMAKTFAGTVLIGVLVGIVTYGAVMIQVSDAEGAVGAGLWGVTMAGLAAVIAFVALGAWLVPSAAPLGQRTAAFVAYIASSILTWHLFHLAYFFWPIVLLILPLPWLATLWAAGLLGTEKGQSNP